MDPKKSNVQYSHLDQRIKTLIDVSQEVLDTDNFIEIAIDRVKTKTKRSIYPEFIRRSLQLLNREELFEIREKYWSMIAQMIINKMFPLSVFQSEYRKMLEETSSKDIDFYVLWMFKAEILKTLIIRGAHPLSELTTTTSVLKKRGLVGKLIGKLLKILIESEGELAFTEKWNASGIKWDDLLDRSLENSIDFICVYDLHCLLRKGHNRKRRSATENVVKDELKASGIELLTDLVDTSHENQVDIIKEYNSKSLTIDETRQLNEQLLNLLRERDFDDIPSWITENVGKDKSKTSTFVRILFTLLLESGIETESSFDKRNFYQPNRSKIIKLLPLMDYYIDYNLESELQCLYALTDVNHKCKNPPGFAYDIIKELHEKGIVSFCAFYVWHNGTAATSELIGHDEAKWNLLCQSFWIKFQESCT